MKRVGLFIVGFLFVFAVYFWEGSTSIVIAQSGGVTWSQPVMFSNPETNAFPPTIIADMAGNIHLMWSQTVTENPPPGEGDTIFYTRWDGKEWTPPADVLLSPDGAAASPELAITPDGMLHAIWQTGGRTARVLYSHAPAYRAEDPKSWSYPISLGSPALDLSLAFAADAQGHLHAAFASMETFDVVYRRSDDGGKTWPVWVDVPGGLRLSDEQTSFPRLTVDGKGRVHMVWTVIPWPGRAVVYARSDDGGDTWNEPQVIDTFTRKDYRADYGPTVIDVEAVGDDEIHLIWDGAPTVERNHVWSADGGKTWSRISIVFPQVTLTGRSGWNDMEEDSLGNLHAVSIQPNDPPLHASWNGAAWSTPDLIPASGPKEWLRIAISQGNQIMVIWTDKTDDPYTNWYVLGQIDAPELATQPLPVPTPLPTATPLPPTPTSVYYRPTPPPFTVSLPEDVLTQSSLQVNPAFGAFVGVMATMLLIGVAFVVNFGKEQWRRKD